MNDQRNLAGKTLFITGASRGIGLAIALRAAQDGANIVIAAKTDKPHPKLPGTIHTAAREIEQAGGAALPLVVDIRDPAQVKDSVDAAVDRFGGLDVCINNASAIQLTGTLETPMRRFDLMHQVNARGTYCVSQACLPHLLKADNPHLMMISPPLNLNPHWFKDHLAYTMAKYGMSLCVLGMAAEFAEHGVGVNALWPRTAIATAALQMLPGVDPTHCRKPEIVADAAHAILTRRAASTTGNFFIDDEVLAAAGIADLSVYAVDPAKAPYPDFFLD
ncbi:MAG: NAD(P)-dependent oxidoreductase [Pseudomonadota bacterium]